MVWLLLALWFLTVLVSWLFHFLMTRELNLSHSSREATWVLERERLLNRCMTKEWTSYAQLQSAMQVSSNSDGEGVGLSDESENAQWAKLMGNTGIGDTTVAEIDLRELGFLE